MSRASLLVCLLVATACGPSTAVAVTASPSATASTTPIPTASPTQSVAVTASRTPAPTGKIAPSASPVAPPVEVTFPSGDLALHGFLYRPPGAGPFPAVLYDHGSEQFPGDKRTIANLMVGAGYVFFVPHRRGHGRSPGTYLVATLDQILKTQGGAAWSKALVSYHENEWLQDQLAGLAYLSALPYVARDRIVVAGCSFGGIQAMLAAERGAGLRASVDFAGGAETWTTSPDLRDRLTRAARGAQLPVFFIQAENDYSITPTRTLDDVMSAAGKAHRATVYPPFGATNADGHGLFCSEGTSVWGADVLAFFAESLR